MLVATTELVAGREIAEVLGMVKGSSIRSRNFFQDVSEWLRNLAGAELNHYTKMMAEAREQALDRMTEDARRIGADAVIGVRFATSGVAAGAAELMAYGTAVRLVAAVPA
ncbi:MAG: YbjQ family protein [Planctomycetota bacterium]